MVQLKICYPAKITIYSNIIGYLVLLMLLIPIMNSLNISYSYGMMFTSIIFMMIQLAVYSCFLIVLCTLSESFKNKNKKYKYICKVCDIILWISAILSIISYVFVNGGLIYVYINYLRDPETKKIIDMYMNQQKEEIKGLS